MEDSEHHVFCSEWVAIVYQQLGMLKIRDPRNAVPTDFITLPDPSRFEDPVPLPPEGFSIGPA